MFCGVSVGVDAVQSTKILRLLQPEKGAIRMAMQKKPEAVIEDGTVYVLKAGTPMYVKTADVCSMTGKTNQWIGQLTAQGVLNKRSTTHGSMYELTSTIRAYCDMLVERSTKQDEEAAKVERSKQVFDAKIKQSKAAVLEMEVKELQGKMHRSEDVAELTEDLVYTIRGMLLALPGRLAVDVAATSDPAETAELIRREVYKVMEELSRYRYDPTLYEEKVRERKAWTLAEGGADDEES